MQYQIELSVHNYPLHETRTSVIQALISSSFCTLSSCKHPAWREGANKWLKQQIEAIAKHERTEHVKNDQLNLLAPLH